MADRIQNVQALIRTCREARNQCEEITGFQTRVLFDMLLLELGKELVNLLREQLATPAKERADGARPRESRVQSASPGESRLPALDGEQNSDT